MKCKLAYVLGGAILAGASRADPPQDSEAAHRRAGHPQAVAPWALPSITPAYCGYYVGGGCLFRRCGDGRSSQEGTWGWDYFGRCFQRRVDLLWWHGRRYQGGTGQYQTDGPHLPDLDDSAAVGHGSSADH